MLFLQLRSKILSGYFSNMFGLGSSGDTTAHQLCGFFFRFKYFSAKHIYAMVDGVVYMLIIAERTQVYVVFTTLQSFW